MRFHLSEEQIAIQDALRGTLADVWQLEQQHKFDNGLWYQRACAARVAKHQVFLQLFNLGFINGHIAKATKTSIDAIV